MSRFSLEPSFLVTPLRRLRYLSGIRQQDLAKALGRSASYLCARESGRVPLSESDARKLSRILKVPVSEILGPNGGGR